MARPRKHSSDAERQREYRARKKAEAQTGPSDTAPSGERGDLGVTAAEPLGDVEATPAPKAGDQRMQETEAPPGQRGQLAPPSPPDEPLPPEVVLTPEQVTEAAYILGRAGMDAYRLINPATTIRGVTEAGVPVSMDDVDRVAVKLGRLLGLDEAASRGEPEPTRSERMARAVEYQRFLIRRELEPQPARVGEPVSHGPDLKPELAKQAAKASKHPGGWDG